METSVDEIKKRGEDYKIRSGKNYKNTSIRSLAKQLIQNLILNGLILNFYFLLKVRCHEGILKIFKSPKKEIKRRQPDEIGTRLLQIEEEKFKCFQESANDPDAQFLMSLLPFLKEIPKHRKLMVRAKLQQVLIDEQNAISSAVLFDSSSDPTQYSVDFSMPQKNSSQEQMQQSLNILPQQLSNGALTHYVMAFNPNTNN